MPRPTVSIVMVYYERLGQLRNTLRSFVLQGYEAIEVIVVDDGSERELLDDSLFANLPFPVRLLRMAKDAAYSNPCVPFNVGIRAASGAIIILQNAECAHVSDIVGHARAHVNEGTYLSYACYSLGEAKTRALISRPDVWGIADLEGLIGTERTATFDGDDAWYNHSVYRPCAYHFCSAMRRENLERLGGFDERYRAGIAYDDVELLARIRRAGLDVRIVDDRIVLHQWHYAMPKRNDHDDRKARNAILYSLVTSEEKGIRPSTRAPRYVAVRLLMPLLVAARRARSAIRKGSKR